jgi:hypothetical protein
MANRFGRFWAKGKMLIDRMRAMQVFVPLRRYIIPMGVVGLVLCSIVFGVVQKNLVWVVAPIIIIGLAKCFQQEVAVFGVHSRSKVNGFNTLAYKRTAESIRKHIGYVSGKGHTLVDMRLYLEWSKYSHSPFRQRLRSTLHAVSL